MSFLPSLLVTADWISWSVTAPLRACNQPPALDAVLGQLDEAPLGRRHGLHLDHPERRVGRHDLPVRLGGGEGGVLVEGHLSALVGLGGEPPHADRDDEHEGEDDQQAALDELHVGRRGHAGGRDDRDHDRADHDDAPVVRDAEQRLDQHAGADHLRDQVADRDDQRADRGGQLDAARVELGVDRVGEGVLAQTLHRLGDDEQGDDPAGEVADRVEEAVVADRGDHAADAEERRRRQVVAGEGDAVDAPVDLTAGRVVAGRGLGLVAEVERQPDDEGDERQEDDDDHATSPLPEPCRGADTRAGGTSGRRSGPGSGPR